MQRAYVTQIGIDRDQPTSDAMRVTASAFYFHNQPAEGNLGYAGPINLAFTIPFDSSPRKIMDAIVDHVVAEHPEAAGVTFSVSEKDVILPTLDRG
jgi:hypothetical protein